ncbi:MAG: DUF1667 domain-containing protein [Eubacteriales bacterium]|nr:DUF1667 domain-containing protein [Eubacteriales bacterium]
MNDTIHMEQAVEIVCIVCPNGCRILCKPSGDGASFSGYRCKRGIEYATAELTRPMRSLTTSVKTVFPDSPVVSVRTDGEIEKSRIREVAFALGRIMIDRRLKTGDVVAENICNTGVNVICTSDRLVHPY